MIGLPCAPSREWMLHKRLNVAVDQALILFYGDHANMTGRILPEHNRGTHVFKAYATTQRVSGPCRAIV